MKSALWNPLPASHRHPKRSEGSRCSKHMRQSVVNTGRREFGVPQGFAQLHSGRANKGRPFYGQAKGKLCPTWQSYAGLPPEEGARRYGISFCVTGAAGRSALAPFLMTGIYGHSGHLLLVPRFFTAFRMTVPVERCRRRRRRIGAWVLFKISRCSSALSGSSFLRKEPNVTTFPLVSPVPHDEEPEPPSTGRGWRR